MPLGIERINARRQQPNPQIVFIKPIPGPDQAIAQDFLERVAAICKPIMIANHLSVMSLEEHEPNLEFVGRNFNAGEVIQLVLRAPYTGHWLPFRHVQMVMMHELAHCNAMHHGPGFWKLRNQYAGQLRELWGKKYTGDGFWGRGRTVLSDQYENARLAADEVMPRALCGGTYRSSRRRKRKRGFTEDKPKISYAERQQRRIAKKFGTSGVGLGGDDLARRYLEAGKMHYGKPKVAQSKRGRELRAAAALERFKQQKEEEIQKEEDKEEDLSSESETESEYEEIDAREEAVNGGGQKLFDAKGRNMIRVCPSEDEGGDDAQQEMRELEQVDAEAVHSKDTNNNEPAEDSTDSGRPSKSKNGVPLSSRSADTERMQKENEIEANSGPKESTPSSRNFRAPERASPTAIGIMECPVCSMQNEASALTCSACLNVLNTSELPDYWKCQSLACRTGQYLNSGDCGVCGLCGARKPTDNA